MSSQNDDLADIRMLYEVTVSDLAFFKSQQWSVGNYALLLYAAMFGIGKLLTSPLLRWERIVFTVFATLIASASMALLFVLQDAINVRRKRLKYSRKRLGKSFRKTWGAQPKSNDLLPTFHLIWVVVVIGAIVSIYLFWRDGCL